MSIIISNKSGVVMRLMLISVGFGISFTFEPAPCSFNDMCVCKSRGISSAKLNNISHIVQVTCPANLFYCFPEFPELELEKLNIMSSELDEINADSLSDVRAEVIQLMDNNIVNVHPQAFQRTSGVLKSLDLSKNQLHEIPLQALRSIRGLSQLNIQRNCIEHIKTEFSSDWGHMRESLTALHLQNNGLQEIPFDGIYSLSILRKLKLLDLDGNKLKNIMPGSFPPSIEILSIANNFLTIFPGDTIEQLKNLTSLNLYNNNIAAIDFRFTTIKSLHRLDLGENYLSAIDNLFNGSLTVQCINMEYNKVLNLSAQAFKGLEAHRINLDYNKIEFIDERTFVGIENTLESLSLKGNNIGSVPKAFSQLKKLKYLDISSNKIKKIDNDVFNSFFDSIQYLFLSGNQLTAVPALSLRGCTRLTQLDLSYNSINSITANDFKEWGQSLKALFIQGNKLCSLPENTFDYTPKLQELNVSFNNVKDISVTAFHKLADSLYMLEMSFMHTLQFPEEALKPLTSMTTLLLDNNAISTLSKTAFYGLGKLQYLDLEHNNLSILPEGLFHSNVHKQLHEILLSFNKITVTETNTFASLSKLRSVSLAGNCIKVIQNYTFVQLPNLITISLSDNKISSISENAFVDIPRILRMDLQNNLLREFSISVFQNVSCSQFPMGLNLSYNFLSHLFVSEIGNVSPLYVKQLDLSNNYLIQVPINFLNTLSESLQHLYISYNLITNLYNTAFGNLGILKSLDLSNNQIKNFQKRTFVGIENVQIVDLSHNMIEQLHDQQFSTLGKLRIINLSFNNIRSLPRDTFLGSKLERVDLSNNRFVVMPSGALEEVGYTLRQLDISHNFIEHLDSTMFAEIPFIKVLNLSNNKLTSLPDNMFSTIQSVLRLDLSYNPMKANFKNIFYYTQKLRTLNLANTLLKSVPVLPLPYLLELNLSSNIIEEINPLSFKQLYQLRILYLRNNHLNSLPPQTWHYMPFLKLLDISQNHIKILTKNSFYGLGSLEHLNLQELPFLERMDSTTLSNQTMLKSLQIQTWPQIEKFRFRLASVLNAVPSLKVLWVNIKEDTLSDQLIGGFSPHLKELRITGENLTTVTPESLDGLESNHGLLLSITHTSIQHLPEQLIAKLLKIKQFTLDISYNKFTSFSLESVYKQATNWENQSPNIISGGLNLQGNKWLCDTRLVKLAGWLRRWLREHRMITSLDVRLQTISELRQPKCLDPETNQIYSIFDLNSDNASVFNEKGAGSKIPITFLSLLINFLCYIFIR